jgi:hypothetical protein
MVHVPFDKGGVVYATWSYRDTTLTLRTANLNKLYCAVAAASSPLSP